jgi:poly-gamma-glutamate synthesis protein (capsule biosynthesis protein)
MKIRALLITLVVFCYASIQAQQLRLSMIEDFESGTINLTSYANEDIAPTSWTLDTAYTYDSSLYSLKLSGNTWKQQTITPLAISAGNVLQVAIRNTGYNARIQGIGFSNGVHTLFYSVDGTATLNIEQWVTVYQGAFSLNAWNLYQLPIADDWWAYFDELPTITSVIYINDLDSGTGTIWFDNLCKLTSEIPVAPQVSILYNIGPAKKSINNTRDVNVSFFSTVIDTDSSIFTYLWDFGDSTFSNLANPIHTFTVTDNHPYTVSLKVTDDTGRLGLARCTVNVDPGLSSMPISMNFVGDIMLARAYEQGGGIIPTQGVNAIFEPTKYLLGDAVDITNANLEVVLTNTGTAHPTKSVVYRGSPNNISGLVYAGIDNVSLANNHVIDYGLSGLRQMQDSLNAKGIIFSGAGANSYEAYTPSFMNRNGLNIAFLRSCDRTGQYNNAQPYLNAGYNKSGFALFTPYYLSQQINAVESVADLKIVEMHGGSEYSLTPGTGYDKSNPFIDDTEDEEYSYYTDVPHQWDIDIRHHAIDEGADIVIVHHPHIIHGFEIYNGKLIAHSLGNFVFDLTYPETMPTMILYADADFNGFSNYRVVPCFIDRFIPRRATGKLGTRILDYLAKRSKDLNTYLLVNKDDATAQVIVDSTTISFMTTQSNLQVPVDSIGVDTYATAPFQMMRNGSISAIDYVHPGPDWQGRLGQECLWMGNMEDEGSSFFAMNLTNEVYDTDNSHEGSRSIKISATSTTETVPIRNRMKWYDNTKKYTLHAWVKTRATTNVNIDISYYSSRTSTNPVSTESLINGGISDNTEWTFYQKEITIPSSCYYYIITLKVGSGSAWFDEVGLIEWTPWTDIALLQTIPYPNDYYWLQFKGSNNPKRIRIQYTEKDMTHSIPIEENHFQSSIFSSLTNYPNPFNPETTITFSLKQDKLVELSIFNIKGQKVKQLTKQSLSKGKHSFVWDGKDSRNKAVSSGIYFYQIQADKISETRKIILLK